MEEVKKLCDVCPHNKGQYKDCNDGSDCRETADEVVPKLYKEKEILEKALELTIKEISRLNNFSACANEQCADPNCDYYTETHLCMHMRKKYWKKQAEEKLKGGA